MSGPWEKYQTRQEGPWTKYQTQQPEQDNVSRLQSGIAGAAQGVSLGFADEMKAGVRGGIDALRTGTPFGENYNRWLDVNRGQLEDARDEHPVAAYGGEIAGAVAPAMLTGGSAGGLYGSGAAYGLGAGEGGFENRAKNAAVSGAVSLGAGKAVQGAGNAIATAIARRGAVKSAPTVEALEAQAGGLYDEAARAGAGASAGQTRKLALEMRRIVKDAELLDPSGKVDDGYAKVASALRVIETYRGQSMSPEKMKNAIRPILREAAKQDGLEGKVGQKMLGKFQELTGSVSPLTREGDNFYSRAMDTDKVRKALETATGGKAGGDRGAIQTQFDNLRKANIRGKNYMPDALAEEVQRVAAGGGMPEKIAAGIGKLAPTSPLLSLPGYGAGALGATALFGPAGGAATAGGAALAGLGGKALGNRLSSGGAHAAMATAARGEALPTAMAPEELRAVLQALLLSQSAGMQPQ